MSKFFLTGILLVLLASFLHYSPSGSSNGDDKTPQASEMAMYSINEQIRIARTDRHISQKDLAYKVGLTRLDIEKIEGGQVVPTRDLLFKIEQALNTSLSMQSY
jgi:ribosome-binding protein aMBF1 (putative translation factor)